MSSSDVQAANTPRNDVASPRALRDRLTTLQAYGRTHARTKQHIEQELAAKREFLELAPQVTAALDSLSETLFERTIRLLEEQLTYALQEVLEQPILLKAARAIKHNAASIEFYIERDGCPEDIMRGQGGSVANILSVGLRMFALTTLDPNAHRRFLVLDEQDCWIRPDLVPRLVKIVRLAGEQLGFQVLMISHHDPAAFEHAADRIYKFTPTPEGVEVEAWDRQV